MTLENRLNTLAVAVIASLVLVYLCSFVSCVLGVAAISSVVPLYVFVQRYHTRYIEPIWQLGGAWKYVFPFVIYLVIGEVVANLLVGGYDVSYQVYVAYGLRTVIVGGILLRYRRLYPELTERKFDLMALLVGLLICVGWVGLEGDYPLFSTASSHYDPTGFGTGMLILLLCLRLIGSVLVAAFIEELFSRSFLMRYVIDPERWAEVAIGKYTFASFAVVALFFGFAHFQWLPGLLTGIILNLLLYKRRNIFACVQAHGMANLLLFGYVTYTQSWNFW